MLYNICIQKSKISLYATFCWFLCFVGSVIGLISYIAGMLMMESTYEGGLGDFYVNTSQDYSLLCAMVAGFVMSAAVSIIVSLCTIGIQTEEEKSKE